MEEIVHAVYYGEESPNPKRVQCQTKGKSLVCVMMENGDYPEVESEAVDICIDSFMRRPSAKQIAVNMICNFMNNIVFMKQRPGKMFNCDSAMLLVSNGKANCHLSGSGNILYFSDMEYKLFNSERTQKIGVKPVYSLDVNNEFALNKGDNSFLLCTDRLLEQIDPEKISKLRKESQNSEEWLNKILDSCEDKKFTAATVILPQKRKGAWFRLLPIAVIAAAVAAGVFLFLR